MEECLEVEDALQVTDDYVGRDAAADAKCPHTRHVGALRQRRLRHDHRERRQQRQERRLRTRRRSSTPSSYNHLGYERGRGNKITDDIIQFFFNFISSSWRLRSLENI